MLGGACDIIMAARPHASLMLVLATAAVVAALETPEACGALSPADLEEMAPLAALRRVGPFDTLTSGLASIARLPYGTTVAEELQPVGAAGARPPAEQLRLYEFEACPYPSPYPP